MQLTDTHCHIHSTEYPLDAEEVYQRAIVSGVSKMIVVGTDVEDSKVAVDWASTHDGSWAAIGVHPHEAKHGINGIEQLLKNVDHRGSIVAIGEIGLDYYYDHSARDVQAHILESQIQLAVDYDMPIIFHVREAFDDFWPIIDNFPTLRGVLHSFTDSQSHLERALQYGFFIGVNGIVSFTKDTRQIDMFSNIPVDRILLETDAPYLTPKSSRGRVNEPVFVREVAESISSVKSTSVDMLALQTTRNATFLFHI